MAFELSPSVKQPTIHGLFVGIETFPSGTIENLDFCIDDAFRQCEGFGLDPAVHMLADEQATRVAILQRLLEMIDGAQEGELLIFSITGHGVIAFNDYFFTPYEADSENILGTCISASMILKVLGTAAKKGAKVLLIIDSCHSGAIGFDMTRYKGGMACLFSCSPMELSVEKYIAERQGVGSVDGRGGNGLFTHHLSECLEHGDPEQDTKVITLRRLYEYIYGHVEKDSEGKQHPLLIGTLESDTVLKLLE